MPRPPQVSQTLGKVVRVGGQAAGLQRRSQPAGDGVGIEFNKDNTHAADDALSDFLRIRILGTGDDGHGYGLYIENVTDGNARILNSGAGDLTIDNTGGKTIVSNEGAGIEIFSTGRETDATYGHVGLYLMSSDDLVLCDTAKSTYFMVCDTAMGNVLLPSIPSSDPSVSKALYVDGSGFVKQSP